MGCVSSALITLATFSNIDPAKFTDRVCSAFYIAIEMRFYQSRYTVVIGDSSKKSLSDSFDALSPYPS